MNDYPTSNAINDAIVDCICGIPQEFKLGSHSFFIRPLSLGKTLLLERMMRELEGNYNSYNGLLAICEAEKSKTAYIIALLTANDINEVFSTDTLNNRAQTIEKEATCEEMAQLLYLIITQPNSEYICKETAIESERMEMKSILDSKDENNYKTFGGNTLYGSLIDRAAERYGWTKEYIVWGIDLVSLKLMLTDSITSVYVADQKRQDKSKVLNADDPENMNTILSMNWD